ncbi:LURP-one-related domain-containing protein [Hirsutella rhossiliensis]|uniref:LURP-one-related domain-containing protein n=1 Tax=Hirsutella rhossiliensis TaxID=111463 RepID=A0A9P8MZQ6_9HYPO|nr:LURP-one-related domain-containing protein [Hirsutella rhossiliensis]KAH0964209.1 LURP-one-related domain-containing protein [Hirsutella rhossiliensis]
MTQLQPVSRQIGIFNNFIASKSETLVLRDTFLSLSGDSFDIKLANGQPLFLVQGQHLATPGRKSVLDTSGNHIFDVVKEKLHMHDTYVIQGPQGNNLFSIRNSLLKFMGSKATAEFQSYLGQTEKLTIRGRLRAAKFQASSLAHCASRLGST